MAVNADKAGGERIKGLNEDLERRVAERTAQLEAANRALQDEIARRERAEAARDRLFSTSSDMMGIAGFDGYFKDVNSAFEKALGFPAAALLERPFLDLVHPEDRAATIAEMEKLSTGATSLHFENRYLCEDGSYKWLEWTAVPVVEEGRIYAVARDMTEHRRVDEELKQLNEELERRVAERTAQLEAANSQLNSEDAAREMAAARSAFLAEASAILASSLDYETTLTSVARLAVPRIADWSNVDLVDEDGQVRRVALAHADPAKEAMAYDYLRRFPPDPNADSAVKMVLRTGKPLMVPEITEEMFQQAALEPEQLKFLQELQPTSSMTVPLIAHDQKLGAITLLTAESGAHYGADDQALAEELARRAAMAIENARLYRQSERARAEAEAVGAELKRAVIELKRSNEELQQFAYVASHDLQEPLRMVASYTQLLSRRYKGKLDSDADEFIGFAVDGANRMQRLINDLLSYSRVSTRGEAFEPTECEAVLEHALVNLHTAIEESSAVITHDPLPLVPADQTQLVQLFQNLIGNAIKFRGKEPPYVHVGVEQKEHEWLFCVRDNGIGMDPQYADRIFVIFQRLHSKAEYPGTGIGLAVCKKIVERHGGRIWVESQPGQGASFYFSIPS